MTPGPNAADREREDKPFRNRRVFHSAMTRCQSWQTCWWATIGALALGCGAVKAPAATSDSGTSPDSARDTALPSDGSPDAAKADAGTDSATDSATPIDSSPPETTNDVAPPDGDGCALSGATCPSGCNAITGAPYDAAANCLKPQEVVACAHGWDASEVITCRLRVATGVLYRFADSMAPLAPEVPGWAECSTADEAKVSGTIPNCP